MATFCVSEKAVVETVTPIRKGIPRSPSVGKGRTRSGCGRMFEECGHRLYNITTRARRLDHRGQVDLPNVRIEWMPPDCGEATWPGLASW